MLESEDDEEEDSEAIPDRLSSGDAWMFPIVSSLSFVRCVKVAQWVSVRLSGSAWDICRYEVLWEGVDKLVALMVLLDCRCRQRMEGMSRRSLWIARLIISPVLLPVLLLLL
jgi:hypothetical protein